jgi:hypothetical protein
MLASTGSARRIILFSVLAVFAGFNGNLGAEDLSNKERLVYVTITYPEPGSEKNTLLLIESIRAFAGSLAQAPVWCLVPQYGKRLSSATEAKLDALNATIIPYDIELDVARFFFAADIRGAQVAESIAVDKTDLLAWLSSNTIILKEPGAFILPDGKSLGYRPVHHTNVGSLYDTAPDPFWTLIYEYCSVPEDRVFPMKTHIDGQTIRPYFNAGIIVTRPENGLFKNWHDTFFNVYREPALNNLYDQDQRYMIFVHQALLSGIILNAFRQDEILEFPDTYNYPLHLHKDDITENKPNLLDELVTVRHEGFYNDPDWKQEMPASDSLKQWLAETLSK